MTLVGQSVGGHTALVVAGRHPRLVAHRILVEADVGGGGLEQLTTLSRAIGSWPQSFDSYDQVRDFFGGTVRSGVAGPTATSSATAAGGPASTRPPCPA